jgi:hypothetical protein
MHVEPHPNSNAISSFFRHALPVSSLSTFSSIVRRYPLTLVSATSASKRGPTTGLGQTNSKALGSSHVNTQPRRPVTRPSTYNCLRAFPILSASDVIALLNHPVVYDYVRFVGFEYYYWATTPE